MIYFTTPNSGRIRQETNYENETGNYFENKKSDSDDMWYKMLNLIVIDDSHIE